MGEGFSSSGSDSHMTSDGQGQLLMLRLLSHQQLLVAAARWWVGGQTLEVQDQPQWWRHPPGPGRSPLVAAGCPTSPGWAGRRRQSLRTHAALPTPRPGPDLHHTDSCFTSHPAAPPRPWTLNPEP